LNRQSSIPKHIGMSFYSSYFTRMGF
jgi:hypothetical protein